MNSGLIMKNRFVSSCFITVVWMIATGSAQAHKATERYIPIGKSPGVSSELILLGTITTVDYAVHEMEVRSTDGQTTVAPAEITRYYIDRSKRKLSNQSATFRDCQIGRRVEIKFLADGSIDWIKIESK